MRITKGEELLENEKIQFIGEIPNLINTDIYIHGKNNILVCEEGVTLSNSRIDFHQDNSILYLSSSVHNYQVIISLNTNSVCFIGKDNFFNGTATMVVSEAKNLIIGNECLFSYNVVIRVSDGHALYSTKNNKRLNHAKSIFIGDHIWFGQNAFIFKGSQIHSGSVIGAGSIVSNKIIPSNVTYAGNPARLIKENTFWIPHSTQKWNEEDIEKMDTYGDDRFKFKNDETTLDFDKIDEDLLKLNAGEALEYIKTYFLNDNKNRFASNKRRFFKKN